MTPAELFFKCQDVIDLCKKHDTPNACYITLVKPKPMSMPAGFPRGELLSIGERGKVYSYNANKVMGWLMQNLSEFI